MPCRLCRHQEMVRTETHRDAVVEHHAVVAQQQPVTPAADFQRLPAVDVEAMGLQPLATVSQKACKSLQL